MRSALVVLSFLAVPAAAHAGGYVSLGVGASPEMGGELDIFEGESKVGRLMIGQRFSAFSLETGVISYDLSNRYGDYGAVSLQVAGKVNARLSGNLEAYGRLALERTWLDSDNVAITSLKGNGWSGGVGLEYRLNVARLSSATIWADYVRHGLDLMSEQYQLVGSADILSLGLSLGL